MERAQKHVMRVQHMSSSQRWQRDHRHRQANCDPRKCFASDSCFASLIAIASFMLCLVDRDTRLRLTGCSNCGLWYVIQPVAGTRTSLEPYALDQRCLSCAVFEIILCRMLWCCCTMKYQESCRQPAPPHSAVGTPGSALGPERSTHAHQQLIFLMNLSA